MNSWWKQQYSTLPLPQHLEISDVLTEDEKPKVHMKIIQFKVPKMEDVGPAFHEKSGVQKMKNSDVGIKLSWESIETIRKKYKKLKKLNYKIKIGW